MFTQKTPIKDRKSLVDTKQCVLSTYTMCSMAVDSPTLDALVLATPQADVTQAVGRIMRTVDSKKTPVVIDMIDTLFPDSTGWGMARLKLWQKMNSHIVESDINGKLIS
jgi:superfamily II DNA or RNA helicase